MATTFKKNEGFNVAQEAEELRQDIAAQMEKRWEKRNEMYNGQSYPVACFLTHDDMRWGGSGKRVYSRSAADIVTGEGLQLAKLFIEGGIKVTPYNKPLKKGKKK